MSQKNILEEKQMKKTIIITGTLMAVAFFLGQSTGNQVKANTGYTIDPAEIVDWNTDGEELSLCMSDESECYAYKQKDCFNVKKRDYLALKDISEVRATSKGFYIIDTDGEEYFFEK